MNFKKNKTQKLFDLMIGIILIIIAISGLFFGSTWLLKLFTYTIPIILLINAIKIFKIAKLIRKTDLKNFIIFIIQVIILIVGALYIIFFPLESLNYIIIILGIVYILNSINNIILTSANAFSFFPFLIGIICILFSKQIINTFYTLALIIMLFIGIAKILEFIYKR